MHDDNYISPVAYLRYHELVLEEKTAEDQAEAEQMMQELIASRQQIPVDHLNVEEESKEEDKESEAVYQDIDQLEHSVFEEKGLV